MKALQLGILSVSGFFQKKIAIPVAKSPMIDIAAIASRSQEKAQAASKEYGISKAYGSYEDLLADQTIEAVYIPLPNHLHAQFIKKAADAGKHIICEKPIALHAKEAEDCITYAHKKGVKVMEAFMYRFHPQWQHARELIRMKEIGKVQLVQCIFTYNNTDPSNIRNQAEAGGGAIMDIGCYAVSSSRFLMGAEPKRVISLTQYDQNFGTDILSTGILDFGDSRAEYTIGTQTFPYQRVNVHGSGGVISIEIPFNTPADVETRLTVTNSVGTREVLFAPEDQYILEFEAFARSIKEDTEVPTPPSDAIANMKVLDALAKSAKQNEWVSI
ncbi:Gfo/Idh/MocA family protein [Catalinimonas niigatensis]|uniref:Gfo/Idh/MocA family protein n=1 Tax=Catalinimonas niigatensis TaxID=1397264 RepID=UPI002665EF89|nr:Gfo/Idh/MocA family oxidoreductase [Catalinimonas niigatensis]WPP50683.1 Gfo/Idh/MocA family oxidoreductase [Catalinimonas niigatensis]